MRIISFYLILFLLPLFVLGQKKDSLDNTNNRFYVGLGLTTLTYHMYYKNPAAEGSIVSGSVSSVYFTPISAHLGFKVNDRFSLEVGSAYGGQNNDQFTLVLESPRNYVEYHFYSKTRVIAIPVTSRFIMFNTYKHFPVFVTASLMPSWGRTTLKAVENRNNEINTTSVEDSGLNTFATAGLGFNYKIWKRFTGNVEVLLIKSNITGNNSKYYDWQGEAPKYIQLIGSFGLGFNYNLY